MPFHAQPAKSLRLNNLITSKQETYGRKIQSDSSRKPSSPTALGLLLRSSVFRELVEKNSNQSEEEISDDDENIIKNQQKAIISSNDGYGGLFCDMNIPFVFSTNGNGIDDQLQGRQSFDYDYSDMIGMASLW